MLEDYESICICPILQDTIDQLHILGRILPVPITTDIPLQSSAYTPALATAGENRRSGGRSSRHELFPKSLVSRVQTKVNYDEDADKLQRDRGFIESALSKLLYEIQSNNTYNILLETIKEEEKRKHDILVSLKNEADCKQTVHSLQTALVNIQHDKEEQTTSGHEMLMHLKDTLLEAKVKTGLEEKYISSQCHARVHQGVTQIQEVEKEVIRKIEKVKKEISEEQRINFEIQRFIRNNLNVLEAKMEVWMERYEKDVDIKDQDIEQLQQQRQTANQRLQEIDELTVIYLNVIEEDREAKRITYLKRKEEERRLTAIVKLQSAWRGTMVRKFLGQYKRLKAYLKQKKKDMMKKRR